MTSENAPEHRSYSQAELSAWRLIQQGTFTNDPQEIEKAVARFMEIADAIRADVADAMVAEEIAKRDAMEEAFSKAYALVMGQPMEWSSAYNQAEALGNMEERLAADRAEAERKAGQVAALAAWNAALDAASQIARNREEACTDWFKETRQHANVYEQLPIVASDIAALKKETQG